VLYMELCSTISAFASTLKVGEISKLIIPVCLVFRSSSSSSSSASIERRASSSFENFSVEDFGETSEVLANHSKLTEVFEIGYRHWPRENGAVERVPLSLLCRRSRGNLDLVEATFALSERRTDKGSFGRRARTTRHERSSGRTTQERDYSHCDERLPILSDKTGGS
jgi:hypothetical protein